MNVWIFILVFAATFLADVFWTLYFLAVQDRRILSASVWSAMIIACGFFTVVNYVDNKLYAIAAIIGAFFGTYTTMKWKEKQ